MKLKRMTFEEAEDKITNYTRFDSSNIQVECSFTKEETKTKLILYTMQVNDFINAIEHQIDSIDLKEDKKAYPFKLGLKTGLEQSLHLWYNSHTYIENQTKERR